MTAAKPDIPALADAIDPRKAHSEADQRKRESLGFPRLPGYRAVDSDILIAASDALRSLTTAVEIGRAMEGVMIGGNHLASLLVMRVGTDFNERFPPGTDAFVALAGLGQDMYDVWACWSNIMLARSALGIRAREAA